MSLDVSPRQKVDAALADFDQFSAKAQLCLSPVTQPMNPDALHQLIFAHQDYALNRHTVIRNLLAEERVSDAIIIGRSLLESSVKCFNLLLAEPQERAQFSTELIAQISPAIWRRDRQLFKNIRPAIAALKSSAPKEIFERLMAEADAFSSQMSKSEMRPINDQQSLKKQLEILRVRSERVQSNLDFSPLEYLYSLSSHVAHADPFGLTCDIGLSSDAELTQEKASSLISIFLATLGLWYYHALFAAHFYGWSYSPIKELYEELSSLNSRHGSV